MNRPATRPHRSPLEQAHAQWADERARFEDRIADLLRAVAGRAVGDGPVAGLSIQQTMIAALIAKRGRVSREVMRDYLNGCGFALEDRGGGALRMQIQAIRAGLAAHRITITTLPGWGWEMDRESRLVWAHLARVPADLDELVRAGKAVAS